MEQHEFQADAQQILKLVTHSLYSDKEVFCENCFPIVAMLSTKLV